MTPSARLSADRIEAVLTSHGKPYRVISATETVWLLPAGGYDAAFEFASEIALALGVTGVVVLKTFRRTIIEVVK